MELAPPCRGHQRVFAAVKGEDSAVDARTWGERASGNTTVQRELEPRRPLRRHHRGTANSCSAPRDFPLHEHDCIGPCGCVQDAAQYGRGLVKRQVADEHMRRRGKPVGQEVVGDNLHVRWESLGQASGEPGVDLDGGHRSPKPG